MIELIRRHGVDWDSIFLRSNAGYFGGQLVNPVPLLAKLAYGVFHKEGPYPKDYDFAGFGFPKLTATLINEEVLWIMESIVKSCPEDGDCYDWLKFLTDSFLRRLRDRPTEPKTVFCLDKDKDDELKENGYDSDFSPIHGLMPSDWEKVGNMVGHSDADSESVVTDDDDF